MFPIPRATACRFARAWRIWNGTIWLSCGWAGTALVYLDGKLAGEAVSEQPADFRQGLSIGSIGGKIGYPFVGTLDEVMIFNRPLPVEEIRRLAEPER